jgi:hypothetical protein
MEIMHEEVRFKSNILEKLFTIHTREPKKILEDYQNGILEDHEVISKLTIDESLEDGTSTRPVTRFNLIFDHNIF